MLKLEASGTMKPVTSTESRGVLSRVLRRLISKGGIAAEEAPAHKRMPI